MLTQSQPGGLSKKSNTYELHIQLELVFQDLLQYLVVPFHRVTWCNFHSYIHKGSPKKPPSECVVVQALRHTWPQFLESSTCSITLKKFPASNISLERCGHWVAFTLDSSSPIAK